MRLFSKRFSLFSLVLLILAAPSLFPQSVSTEWKLKVVAAAAAIRSNPDLSSPAETTVSRDTLLTAHEKSGAWYRVVIGSAKEGLVLIGYIAASDVALLGEKPETAVNFWSQEDTIPGLGLGVRLQGGAAFFSVRDLDSAVSGLEALEIQNLAAWGFTIRQRQTSRLRSGYGLGGEISYSLSPRLALGLGFGYSRTILHDLYWLYPSSLPPESSPLTTMASIPIIQLFSAQIVVSYSLPLSRVLALTLGAGPAVGFSTYYYSRSFDSPDITDVLVQNVKGNALGAFARIGLEAAINTRAAAFFEVRGRIARVSDFEGGERAETTLDVNTPLRKTTKTIIADGTLYFVSDGGRARFDVRTTPPSGSGEIRKAVLDLSGFDLAAGLRLKF